MNKEHEFRLEPGTWVAQDRNGRWFQYAHSPRAWGTMFSPRGVLNMLLLQKRNPHWRETRHQIQPGEVIYLSEEEE